MKFEVEMACMVQVYMTLTVDVADEATARGLANEAATCFNANPPMTISDAIGKAGRQSAEVRRH